MESTLAEDMTETRSLGFSKVCYNNITGKNYPVFPYIFEIMGKEN